MTRQQATRGTVVAPLIAALTFATGTLDVASFAVLGSAFTSVMTGNLVFLGLSVGSGSSALALHTGTAVMGYIMGGLLGSAVLDRIVGDTTSLWPRAVTATLKVELLPLGLLTVAWWTTHGRPHGAAQDGMLMLAGAAMGIQSAAVRGIRVPVSTTYMTGTLTTLVATLTTRRDRRQPVDRNAVTALVSIVAGAAVGSWALGHAGWFLPILPLSALLGVIGFRRLMDDGGTTVAMATG